MTLHTGMLQTVDETKGFLTLSKSTCHKAPAVIAHLVPIVKRYLDKYPVSRLHLQSDSPTAQYRKKNLFYSMCEVLTRMFSQITSIIFNYSEGGHSKGGRDGLGGWAKNTANDAAKHGRDVATFEALVALLKEKSKNVLIETIDESDIDYYRNLIPKDLRTFEGTMQMHQFTWSKEFPRQIFFNSVSCYACAAGTKCSHFSLPGSPWTFYMPPEETNKEVRKRKGPEDRDQIQDNPAKKPQNSETTSSKDVDVGDWVVLRFGCFWYPGQYEFYSSHRFHLFVLINH